MKVPPRSQNGRVMRLRGKGAPQRGSDARGDLYVRLVAELPDQGDADLDEVARSLEGFYGDHDPRRRMRGGR